MPWQSLNLTLPPAVQTIAQAIGTGLDAVKNALTLVQTQARVTQALVQTEEGDRVRLVNAAIQAAVATITTFVNELLDTTGVYVLVVPLPKKGLVALASRPNNPDEPGSNFVQVPQQNLLNGLPAGEAARVRQSPSFAQIFNPDDLFLGGNAYFVKTIAEALYDPGDRNRPKFDAASYWAYSLLVAGATDVTSLLSAATFFDRLFSTTRSANRVSASRGVSDFVPRGLRVGPSGRSYFPVLEWERVPQSVALLSYDGARVVPTEYAIIRSTDFRAKTATQVRDLFDDVNLREGQTGRFGARVLKVAPYDGVLNRFIDGSEQTAGQSYFYHVAFKSRTEAPAGVEGASPAPPRNRPGGSPRTDAVTTVNNPYNMLSSCAEWRRPTSRSQLTDARMGVAPDWARTPSVATLLPGLERLLDRALENLASLGVASRNLNERNNAYLDLLGREVDRLSRQISEINGYLSQLQAIFATPDADVFATIRQGRGGVGSFLSDVVLTMDDTSDANRPSFDTGDEYVTGVVLLCVGPDPAPIAAAFAMLQGLFGPPSSNDALAGIDSIQTALAEAEAAVAAQLDPVAFGSDMQPRPPGEPDASCT
jgi:hypothetical protein